MTKLCIMYLTDPMRPFTFPRFVKELSACKYLSDIELLILAHDQDPGVYRVQVQNTGIQYKLAFVPSPNNYLHKIAITLEYMTQNNIPYLMKHDNDIVMSSHLYDYLFEQLQVLEEPKNLVLTPTLTSGIPTCEMFFQEYLTKEEQERLGSLFLNYTHGPLWGTDYTALNTFTSEATSWNPKDYFSAVKQHPHAYKGIHPLRMSKEAILQLNEYVLKYKDTILSKDNYSLEYDAESPYFCNSVFCIKKSTYETILQREDLYVDPFDEVPLNKWRDMFNLNLVIVKRGVAIHPFYNTIPDYLTFEKNFISSL